MVPSVFLSFSNQCVVCHVSCVVCLVFITWSNVFATQSYAPHHTTIPVVYTKSKQYLNND